MLLFELIVFLTTIFYGLRGVKATRILTQVRQNFGPKPIMGLPLRNSIFYFLMYVPLARSLINMFGNANYCLAFFAASPSRHSWCAALSIVSAPHAYDRAGHWVWLQSHERYYNTYASQVAQAGKSGFKYATHSRHGGGILSGSESSRRSIH